MRSAPFLTGLLLGFCLLARAAQAGEVKKEAPKSSIDGFLKLYAYYPVPFEYDPNEPFLLKGTLGGQRITYLVDTGGRYCIIATRRGAGLKTLKELQVKLSDPVAGVIADPELSMVPSFTISQARFVNQPVRVTTIDIDNVQPAWSMILGMDFLRRNFCIIDCGGLTIYFRGAKPTPEQANAIAESLRRSGFTPVPFRGDRRIVITTGIGETAMDWMVDTGSRYTMLEESQRVKLKIPKLRSDDGGSFLPTKMEGRASGLNGLGLGTKEMHTVELPELTVGDRHWAGVISATADINLGKENEPAAREVHGLFGADLLMMHGAVIDFSSSTIWLPPQH